jgi:sterol desaturase/sphingolipid hydroxylase (fatty acid hydroxylase superfamily)
MDKLSGIGPVISAGVFFALFAAEEVWPLRRRTRPRRERFAVNLALSLLAVAVGALLVQRVGFGLATGNEETGRGLINIVKMPDWARFMLGFLLMDLSFYYWHRANHRLPLLWRFHNVHHIDPDLDATTSFRFHAVEVGYSACFRVIQVLATGATPLIYLAYEVCFTCGTIFHHSDLRLPVRVERLLGKVFVTPRMHGIHHSQVMRETNSNYSTVFRWWDTLHGTLLLGVPQDEIRIGVPAYASPEDNTAARLLVLPFTRQRGYWDVPEGQFYSRGKYAKNEIID